MCIPRARARAVQGRGLSSIEVSRSCVREGKSGEGHGSQEKWEGESGEGRCRGDELWSGLGLGLELGLGLRLGLGLGLGLRVEGYGLRVEG